VPLLAAGRGGAPPAARAECGDPAGDDFMRPELGGGSGSCSWQVGPGPARSDHAHGPAGAAGLQRGQRAPGTRRDSIRAR
jgi:hypothetical protein